MKVISKSRGTVWTPPLPSDPDISFEVAPLTPKVIDSIANEHMTTKLEQVDTDGVDTQRAKLAVEFKTQGVPRAQAKAVVRGWKGFTADDGSPLPFTPANVALIFDEYDESGEYAAHVQKYASQFSTLKDASLKN